MKKTHCKRGHLRSLDNLYRNGYCKTCSISYCHTYYSNNADRMKAYSRDYSRKHPEQWLPKHLWRTYKLSLAQFNDLVVKQSGVCAICGTPPKKRLSVDHCHVTNKIRGLLCDVCNRIVLPVVERYKDRIPKAEQYLCI